MRLFARFPSSAMDWKLFLCIFNILMQGRAVLIVPFGPVFRFCDALRRGGSFRCPKSSQSFLMLYLRSDVMEQFFSNLSSIRGEINLATIRKTNSSDCKSN